MFYDLIDYSCLNGWATGNVASSGKDLAQFYRDLFGAPIGQSLLLPAYVDEMLVFKNLTNDWNEGWDKLGIQHVTQTAKIALCNGDLLDFVSSSARTMHTPHGALRIRVKTSKRNRIDGHS